MEWLAGIGLSGIKGKIALGLLVLAATVAFTIIRVADNAVEDTLDTAKDAGAAAVVVEGQNATIEQVGDINAAANEIRNDVGFARYCQCLRDAAQGFTASCIREIRDKSLLDDEQVAAATCTN